MKATSKTVPCCTHAKMKDNSESFDTQLNSVSPESPAREWNRFSWAKEEVAEELWKTHSPQKDGELTCFRGVLLEHFRLSKSHLSIPPWVLFLFDAQ